MPEMGLAPAAQIRRRLTAALPRPARRRIPIARQEPLHGQTLTAATAMEGAARWQRTRLIRRRAACKRLLIALTEQPPKTPRAARPPRAK